MIEIKNLTETDKGKVVKYKSTMGNGRFEYGKITSWNESYIFVDYYGLERGTATGPHNLSFDDTVELKFDKMRNIWNVLPSVKFEDLTK
jgi:hypothetical protein